LAETGINGYDARLTPHIDVSDLTVGQKNTDNAAISGWVEKSAGLYKPDQIFWCSGSDPKRNHAMAQCKIG
jgi:GTP-dependent phosphoenolpyruvate carboxykinase